MARAVGKGLRYFPKDVDYYMDDRIMDLLDAFGPLGQTVYDVMLTMVYREGYYLEMSPDRLARQIIRWIGSQWVESREKVVEVLGFIAEVGLVDKALYRQGVTTSAAKAEPKVAAEISGKNILKEIYVPGKLVNIVAK